MKSRSSQVEYDILKMGIQRFTFKFRGGSRSSRFRTTGEKNDMDIEIRRPRGRSSLRQDENQGSRHGGLTG